MIVPFFVEDGLLQPAMPAQRIDGSALLLPLFAPPETSALRVPGRKQGICGALTHQAQLTPGYVPESCSFLARADFCTSLMATAVARRLRRLRDFFRIDFTFSPTER